MWTFLTFSLQLKYNHWLSKIIRWNQNLILMLNKLHGETMMKNQRLVKKLFLKDRNALERLNFRINLDQSVLKGRIIKKQEHFLNKLLDHLNNSSILIAKIKNMQELLFLMLGSIKLIYTVPKRNTTKQFKPILFRLQNHRSKF